MPSDENSRLKEAKACEKKTGHSKASPKGVASKSEDRFAVLLESSPSTRVRKRSSELTKQGSETPTPSHDSGSRFAALLESQPARKRSFEIHPKQNSEKALPVDDSGKNGGRARDEVFSEIRALLETNSVLEFADFDYRIRQHLHAMLGAGGRERLREALKAVNLATSGKPRSGVKNWPAYLRKLLTKFEEDRRVRDKGNKIEGADPLKANKATEEDDEEEAWLTVLNKDLPKEDQWLQDLPTGINTQEAETQQQRQPAVARPSTSGMRPPMPSTAPPTLPPSRPPVPSTPPPALPPSRAPMPSMPPPPAVPSQVKGVSKPPVAPPTVPPAAPPPTGPPAVPPAAPPTVSELPVASQTKGASKPPVAPPRHSPESYLRTPPPKSQATAEAEDQQEGYTDSSAKLEDSAYAVEATKATSLEDFPLQAWAEWLRFPPQLVA